MPKCPHCDFDMSIDILPKGTRLLARWSCLRCECVYSGDGTLQLIAVRSEVCSHTEDIGQTFAPAGSS